ncbi:class I SAM-dependent methyltransferase [Paenibacillus sp. 19GGS1-52]|uniref:class I SAM-dependent methyltransferase n=1 Tax=Paenibacillus sp. 19GGS1-52 TaxID=2758563 RepID=UPI001EFB5EBF|nr:class I SAM-dependent methyltransferase [Paenibacillus sp. 19GGS1-52]ULO08037.1 class I SAM-dependent methyltransferase [Paenibacillus sp. 19GGS1-52]
MSENKITPASIMHQIRSGVRKQELQLSSNDKIKELMIDTITLDSDLHESLHLLNSKINRLVHRVTPNMPVAFMEPRLVSRYKILNKFITPLRKFGNRLFTKWYVDTITNQQKYLNNDIWFGLNNSIEIIVEQNKLITHLVGQISGLEKKTDNFQEFITEFNQKYTLKDFHYSDFAERFSGSGEEVKRIFTQYLQYFKITDTIIDIGCGKGYFLELLKENTFKGIGVDTDLRLIQVCKDKGLEAYVHEGGDYLFEQNDSSIDAVFFAHVIEHLTVPQKIAFLNLCYQKLVVGGVLIIETPNTTSNYVMNNLYYLDPTHEKPLFPEALKHLAEMAGFNVINSYLSEKVENIESEIQYYNFSLILEKN